MVDRELPVPQADESLRADGLPLEPEAVEALSATLDELLELAAPSGRAERPPARPAILASGVVPGATEPAPVNKQAEEEFWADPPWQQAREKNEREAAERAAGQRAAVESETAQRVAAERGAAEAAAARCVVPSLVDQSLSAARRSLHAAHCTLGKVSRSRGRRGTLVVNSQSPGHDKVLPSEAAVQVRLGPARRRRG